MADRVPVYGCTLETPLAGPVDLDAATIVAAVADHADAPPAYDAAGVFEYAAGLVAATGATGLRTSLIAAQTLHETNFLRFGGQVRPGQNNLAGLGSTNDGAAGASFPSLAAGCFAVCAHHLAYMYGPVERWPAPLRQYAAYDPRAAAVAAAGMGGVVKTIGDYTNGRWAWTPGIPAGSLDNGYARAIVTIANALLARRGQNGGSKMASAPRIALSAGHHNKQGGDATEIQQTGRLTAAAAAACRLAGIETVVLTPNDGLGTSPDSLDTIAARTPAGAVLFCEFHTEGGPPGVFAVYPDWGDDVDADVRDRLGPALAGRIAAATGLSVRGGGVMSERVTAVGAGGDRLGVFRATADRRADLTRLILEVGSHTSTGDLAVYARPGFYGKFATAFAAGVAAFLGLEVKAQTPPAENPAAWHCTEGGRDLWVLEPFLSYWRNNGGLPVFGLPATPELREGFVTGDVIAIQYFERARLELHKDGSITRGLVGAELAAALHLPGTA